MTTSYVYRPYDTTVIQYPLSRKFSLHTLHNISLFVEWLKFPYLQSSTCSPFNPFLIVVFFHPPSRNDGIEKSCMPRMHRKEQRWLTQKSCRREKGVQRRPAIHRFVSFIDFFTPATIAEVIAPLRFSFCIGVKVVAHYIYRYARSSERGFAFRIGSCDWFFFAGAATGTVVADGISGQ
ncbi:hypothetical protein HDV63DRAFT_369684 [Trichoderma sp. SZMC 28014]